MHLKGELLQFIQHFQVLYTERSSRNISTTFSTYFNVVCVLNVLATQLPGGPLVTTMLLNTMASMVCTFLALE